ncbi:MAG: sulfotransferase [Pseudomonadota bacterium]
MNTPQVNHGTQIEIAGALESQLAADGDNPAIMAKLAQQYQAMGRPDQAMALAEDWLEDKGPNPSALKIYHDTSLALGETAKAKRAINQALALSFDQAPLLADLARCFETEGRNREALILYRHLIDTVPANSPHRPAVVARFANLDDSEAPRQLHDEIAALAESVANAPAHRALLHHVMARHAEDANDYDRAFAGFYAAGEIIASASSPETLSDQLVDQYQHVFSDRTFGADFPKGSSSDRPIFVFGMQRSGTKLTEHILSSHPQVHGAGNVAFFDMASNWISPDRMDPQEIHSLSASYLELLDSHNDDARHVVDSNPDNFKHLWLIAAAFPNASFIYCCRNALDTCVSCLRHPISKAYRKDLTSIATYFVNHVRLVDLWKAVLPIHIHELNYEKLVANPETEIRRLIAHVGLAWDDACVEPHNHRQATREQSGDQTTEAINDKSIGIWRHYKQHIAPLIEALRTMAKQQGI